MTLYVLIGLPGAGKSTFAAEHPEMTVVCPDSIRAELYGDESNQADGARVFAIAYNRINAALAADKDVIFDATNTQRRYRKDIFKKTNAERYAAVYFNTSIEVCKERNAKRARVVPETVIDRMARKLNPPDASEGWDEIITKG